MPTQSLNATIERIIQTIQLTPRLGTRLTGAYRSEIPDYTRLPQNVIDHDVLPHSVGLVEHLLDSIRRGPEADARFDDQLRDSAVRRYHQGVSIEALGQSYRLWGRTVWEEVRHVVQLDDLDEVAAVLEIAERIMTQIDHASVVVAQAFFEEVAGIRWDRSLLRGETLDALLSGDTRVPSVQRRIALLFKDTSEEFIVVVVQSEDRFTTDTQVFREVVELLGEEVRSTEALSAKTRRPLLGVRGPEVIAIYPVIEPDEDAGVYSRCREIAEKLPRMVVGTGRRHEGIAGITAAYGEATEAASIAFSLERFGQVTHFRDVLLDHIVRASDHALSLIEDAFTPLEQYDAERGSALVQTLRTFYESRYSLTRSAKILHVHPNTIAYRLRRIYELTGLDSADPDQLLILSMGLKLGELKRD